MTAAERGREVREQLLAAATALIPELGWSAVSTRAVAAKAGVTAGLVHYHFSSVSRLLREAAVGPLRQQLAAATALLAESPTAEDGLHRMLSALDAHTGRDADSRLFVEAYLASTRDEQLRNELAALLDEFRVVVAQWLSQLGRPLPEQTAAVLAAAIDGILLHRALDPDLRAAAVAPILGRLLSEDS